MAKPRFRIFQDRAGQYRWSLISGNNEIVAVSEGYKYHSGAENSVNLIQFLAPIAEIRDEVKLAAILRSLRRK